MIRLMRFLKPYWLEVVGVLILTLFGVFSELFLPRLMGNIVDRGIATGDINYIYRTGFLMLLIAVLGTIATVYSRYLSATSASAYGRDLRGAVFAKVQDFTLNEFDKMGTSSMITRTTNDINQMQQVTIMSMRMMVRAPFMLIGGLIMAITTNLELSKVLLIAAPILIGVITLVGYKGFPLFKEIQKKIDGLNKVLREELTGIRVIRAFNKTSYEEKRFNVANRSLTDTALKVARLMALMMPLLSLILNFTIIGVIWYGSGLISRLDLEVGGLMAFIQYVSQIMFSLIMVSMIFVTIPRASASATRINEVLDLETEIIDGTDFSNDKIKGELEFRDVGFSYQGAESPAVCNISFKTSLGRTTAIIGGTGSGKTTLLNLIMRFYDVSEGEILLNGENIKDLKQEELRKHFGLVSQKPLLFTGSIRDNIRFGNDDATDDEIIEALKISQIYDFVKQNEKGLDYVLAQGGKNLSGGQKQRLSIARALVRKPEIYLFDDSFSALDFKTDRMVRDNLKKVTEDSAIVIIAQRVSTIRDADNIIVLDEGKIVGQGRHEDLVKNCDVYREIVLSQLGEEALK